MQQGLSGWQLPQRTKRGVASCSREIYLPVYTVAGIYWLCMKLWGTLVQLFVLVSFWRQILLLRASQEEIDSKSAVSYSLRCVWWSHRLVSFVPLPRWCAAASTCLCLVLRLSRFVLRRSSESTLIATRFSDSSDLFVFFSLPHAPDLWSFITDDSFDFFVR